MGKEGYIQMYRLLYGLDQPMKTCAVLIAWPMMSCAPY